MANPLDGTRVIDITGVIAGPACSWILADLGADVIKVESLTSMDRALGIGAPAMFTSLNRHKRSIAADLKNPRGKEILSKLFTRNDVLVENIGPGAMNRLGFSYEAVKEINPRMIYCSIKGYGPGPYENRLGYDIAAQSQTGLLYMTGTADEPRRMGTAAVDFTTATFSALAIILALRTRDSTGRGTLIENGLFESAAFLMTYQFAQAIVLGKSPPPLESPGLFFPIYEIFTAADGKYFLSLVTDVIAKLPREELLERLEKCAVVFAPVNSPVEALDHPQLKAPNKTCKVSYAGLDKSLELAQIPLSTSEFTPPQTSRAPELGQNTEEILGELGYTQGEIASFVQDGIVAQSG